MLKLKYLEMKKERTQMEKEADVIENKIKATTNAYPNPFNEVLIINLENYLPEKMIVNLYNLQGQLLQAKRLFEGSNLLETTNIQSGLYLLEFIERGKQIKSVKVIKY